MKKTRILSFAIAVLTVIGLVLTTAMPVSAASQTGVIINQDASVVAKAATNAEGYKNFALGFKDTQVTDYVISLNSVSAGLTYIPAINDAFKTIGINTWLSFRMNDAQDATVEPSSLLGAFISKNPNYKRVKTGINTNKYFNNCLDYTYEAVRKNMLNLINTALTNYDCYGIELDFQREIWLWYTGGEYNGIEILNDFMRDVDRLTKTYSAKYGHDIKVAVRCASDFLTNYEFGLDLGTWASEGIIDQVTPTGRYNTTDTDIPVRLWTSFAKPYGITVAPCIEKNLSVAPGRATGNHTVETISAVAASFLSQGADKIYLFNYHAGMDGTFGPVANTVGSLDKLMTVNRRMILTYNDTHQLWTKSNAQLPVSISSGTTEAIHIPVGQVPAGATVTLKFAVNTVSGTAPKVYVNSEEATYVGTQSCTDGFTSNKLLTYTVPTSAHNDTYILAEITPIAGNITIDYAEVYVKVAG